MINYSIYRTKRLAIFILACLIAVGHAFAGNDENEFRTGFVHSLQQFRDFNLSGDLSLIRGKVRFMRISDPEKEWEKLDFPFFRTLLPGARENLDFLYALSEQDKENLVRSFHFHEALIGNELNQVGLPGELKYLAAAVSAMNPMYAGRDARAGLWQLSHFQAILNGGEVNRMVDDRFNPVFSTQMAIRQLAFNSNIFPVLDLAVAGFWFGNTTVKNAMAKAGNKNLEEIISFLPVEFCKKASVFQAVALFLHFNRFEQEPDFMSPHYRNDSVIVSHRLHFQQIDSVLHIPAQKIMQMNPQYVYAIIPETHRGKKIALPAGNRNNFVLWQDSVARWGDSTLFSVLVQKVEYPPVPERHFAEPFNETEIEGKTRVFYRIRTGDVLGTIAEKFDVGVNDLKIWNNIYNERRIQAGQRISIYVPEMDADYYSALDKQVQDEKSPGHGTVAHTLGNIPAGILQQFDLSRKIEHVVKNGESPFVIAKKYEGVTPELIMEWNKIEDPGKIQVGQKLVIYLKKTGSAQVFEQIISTEK